MIRRPATRPGTLKYVSFGFSTRGDDDGDAMLLLLALTSTTCVCQAGAENVHVQVSSERATDQDNGSSAYR